MTDGSEKINSRCMDADYWVCHNTLKPRCDCCLSAPLNFKFKVQKSSRWSVTTVAQMTQRTGTVMMMMTLRLENGICHTYECSISWSSAIFFTPVYVSKNPIWYFRDSLQNRQQKEPHSRKDSSVSVAIKPGHTGVTEIQVAPVFSKLFISIRKSMIWGDEGVKLGH